MDRDIVLNQALLKIGGSCVDEVSGNFKDCRVIDFLFEYGTEFSTENLERLTHTPFPDYQRDLDPVQCHRNCLDLACYVGSGPENIVETTLPRLAYFGFVVPDGVDLRGVYFVPSNLGEELDKWRTSFSSSAL